MALVVDTVSGSGLDRVSRGFANHDELLLDWARYEFKRAVGTKNMSVSEFAEYVRKYGPADFKRSKEWRNAK